MQNKIENIFDREKEWINQIVPDVLEGISFVAMQASVYKLFENRTSSKHDYNNCYDKERL